jgi:hypothetical protein
LFLLSASESISEVPSKISEYRFYKIGAIRLEIVEG